MGWFIAVLAVALMIVLSALRMSGICSRMEEKAHPCAYCLRWEECNGVDADICPICNDG